MVTSVLGHQYELHTDAKCDIMGTLWRILGVNNSAQRVFGEATGFSLLLTTLHDLQGEGACKEETSVALYLKVFTYLLRLITAAVCGNTINRAKLNALISSQTFFDLLTESGLLHVESERQVIQLLLELALEIVLPPFSISDNASSVEDGGDIANFILTTPSGMFSPDKERVYNAAAIRVLLRSLLHFTPQMQLNVLGIVEKLALAGPFNQETLTSVGKDGRFAA